MYVQSFINTRTVVWLLQSFHVVGFSPVKVNSCFVLPFTNEPRNVTFATLDEVYRVLCNSLRAIKTMGLSRS
jgi:hypothetical protein